MSRQALKNVLLDLKSQMRGKRASSYIKKVSIEEPVKAVPGLSKKAPGDSDIDDVEGSEKILAPSKKPVADKVDGPVDFADEMKKFFKKQNLGKKRDAPTASAFGSFASDTPKASPAVKKKGRK